MLKVSENCNLPAGSKTPNSGHGNKIIFFSIIFSKVAWTKRTGSVQSCGKRLKSQELKTNPNGDPL
uniref:Uncharacterized protein n=1 Tax=mine drainage metagenome TaxID=410659 RepID=E6QKY1_9ZZZZ